MTTWNALDHHATVTALTEALPDHLTENRYPQDVAITEAAEQIAAGLARQGLALVPLTPATTISPLQAQAEESWFSTTEEQA